MSKPRVFISSTYYDLKHVRASLCDFIESLGFEPILHERGNIAYLPNVDLDESCRIEISRADIVVLIVGGRYGSPTSSTLQDAASGLYDSVTRSEFRVAADGALPIWVMVERSVWHDWENYSRNQSKAEFAKYNYAHTSDSQVFSFIDEIKTFRNKSIYQFDDAGEIVAWLRSQWAGTIGGLLREAVEGRKLGALAAQVGRLEALVSVLRDQLDFVVAKFDGHGDTSRVIAERQAFERRRHLEDSLLENQAVITLRGLTEVAFEDLIGVMSQHKTSDALLAIYVADGILSEAQADQLRKDLDSAMILVRQL